MGRIIKSIKEDIKDAKQQGIGFILKELLIGLTKGFIITIILLYVLTRPYTCETEDGKRIQMEELKFHYNNIKADSCKYELVEDITYMIKAITYQPNITITEKNKTLTPWGYIE